MCHLRRSADLVGLPIARLRLAHTLWDKRDGPAKPPAGDRHEQRRGRQVGRIQSQTAPLLARGKPYAPCTEFGAIVGGTVGTFRWQPDPAASKRAWSAVHGASSLQLALAQPRGATHRSSPTGWVSAFVSRWVSSFPAAAPGPGNLSVSRLATLGRWHPDYSSQTRSLSRGSPLMRASSVDEFLVAQIGTDCAG